jgi:hypothetical protein
MANEQKKFLVLFLIPVAVMDGWAKTDPTEKKAAEDKLKGEWDAWMKERAAMILSTEAAGKTKRVTAAGVADARLDLHRPGRVARSGREGIRRPPAFPNPASLHRNHGAQADGRHVGRSRGMTAQRRGRRIHPPEAARNFSRGAARHYNKS